MSKASLVLTSKEVANWLRVTEQTVRRWRSDGKGPPFFRMGRQVRYYAHEVLSWLDENKTGETGNEDHDNKTSDL